MGWWGNTVEYERLSGIWKTGIDMETLLGPSGILLEAKD